jgi:protein-tyrosine-phosphatase
MAAAACQAGERTSVDTSTIVFVCQHGSVKSTVAAAHFNRVAHELGLPFTAVSRGIDPDVKIPAGVRSGLVNDGLSPGDETPQGLTAEEAVTAARVIAFDPVPRERDGGVDVTYWSDVPPVTKDYDAARTVILRHIKDLMSQR